MLGDNMDKKELEKFKKRLLNVKHEIMYLINLERGDDTARDSVEEIDQAADLIEQEMGSLMSSNHHTNLAKVEEALKRIENKTYGKCLGCQGDIPIKRLKILPFARHCVSCQQILEDES
jgi:DnaK suppressor protein